MIPKAQLRIIERAGHDPHSERPDEVMGAVRDFLEADIPETLMTKKIGGEPTISV